MLFGVRLTVHRCGFTGSVTMTGTETWTVPPTPLSPVWDGLERIVTMWPFRVLCALMVAHSQSLVAGDRCISYVTSQIPTGRYIPRESRPRSVGVPTLNSMAAKVIRLNPDV